MAEIQQQELGRRKMDETESGVVSEKYENKYPSLFLVDWDNTLFSTDYLHCQGIDFTKVFSNELQISDLDLGICKQLRLLEEVTKP